MTQMDMIKKTSVVMMMTIIRDLDNNLEVEGPLLENRLSSIPEKALRALVEKLASKF